METGEEKWSGHRVFSRLPSPEAAATDLPRGGGVLAEKTDAGRGVNFALTEFPLERRPATIAFCRQE